MDGGAPDELDYAILYQLQENGRQAITDIADVVDVADNTVRNRIQRLEAEGVIEGYGVELDYDNAGVQHHYQFVCTAPISERERLAGRAREHDGVLEVVTLMTGTNNVMVRAAGVRKEDITYVASDLDEMGLTVEHEYLIKKQTQHPFSGFRTEHTR